MLPENFLDSLPDGFLSSHLRMKWFCSLTVGLLLAVGVCPARADEVPPVPYHKAPLIPWAKEVGEHRFRSPRSFDGTLEYYHKTVIGKWEVSLEKICNNTEVRAVHIKNKKPGAWEGINIYEVKGTAYIYVVLTDDELDKIAQQKAKKAKAKKK